jgi:dienelactone hydrolase
LRRRLEAERPEEPSARPRLVDAAASTDKRLEVYPGDSHGWDLLYRAPYKARVNTLVFAFLHEHSQ